MFVSSPGDCEPERRLVAAIVRRLNDTEDARTRTITLEPTTWEDLPPGPAGDAGYQARIDALMKRYDRDRFEIYLGFMKDRLGTPTGSYPSGTVAEFEAALARHGRTGSPAEVLFYFLRPDGTRSAAVEEFADDLRARRFLYGVSPTPEQFEAQVTTHLSTVVREWFAWRNRARRLVRRSRQVAAALAGILLVLWCAYDFLPAWRLTRMLEHAGPADVAQAWSERRPYMLTTGGHVRRTINQAFDAAVAGEPDAMKAMDRYADWYGSATYHESDDRVRAGVGARVRNALQQQLIAPGDGSVELGCWHNGVRTGLLTPDQDGAILAAIEGKRLFGELSAQGDDPCSWGGRLRPDGIASLSRFAREVFVADPLAANWSERAARHALTVWAGDWTLAAAAATDAFRSYDSPQQPEIAYFVRSAPGWLVQTWLSETVGAPADVPTDRIARVVDAVVARGDADVTLALIDVSNGDDGARALADMLDDVKCPLPACAVGATERVRRLVIGAATYSSTAVDVLLQAFDASLLSGEHRERLTRRLLAGQDPGANPITIQALFRLRTAPADRFLAAEVGRHIGGRVFFAMSQRAALIDAASAAGRVDALAWARALAQASLRDVGEYSRANGEIDPGALRLDPGGVLTSYLRLLTMWVPAELAQHRRTLDDLLVWRITDGVQSIQQSGFDEEMVSLLDALDDKQLIALLGFPRQGIDRPSSRVSKLREYLIARVVDGRPPSPGVCEVVAANVRSDEVRRTLLRGGAACARAYLSAD